MECFGITTWPFNLVDTYQVQVINMPAIYINTNDFVNIRGVTTSSQPGTPMLACNTQTYTAGDRINIGWVSFPNTPPTSTVPVYVRWSLLAYWK